MNVDHSQWVENFDVLVRQAGACAWGICDATPLPQEVVDDMRRWIEHGNHAGMHYLARHADLKSSPQNVLPESRSVVSLVFPYYTSAVCNNTDTLIVSRHALGNDYHKVIKKRLQPLCHFIRDDFGGRTRGCVDSAPLAERYWAVKCRLGAIGRNGLLNVPGYGSWVFLAEILTTALLPAHYGKVEHHLLADCADCRKCLDACPGRAIAPGNKIDSSRCRAYLTIENRESELPEGVNLNRRIYGCDICQEVCPANSFPIPESDIFSPRHELLNLTREQIEALDHDSFRALTSGTSMERITLSQLKRNAGI